MTPEEMEEVVTKLAGQVVVVKDLFIIMLARNASQNGDIDEYLEKYSSDLTKRYKSQAVNAGAGFEMSTELIRAELDKIIAAGKRIAPQK